VNPELLIPDTAFQKVQDPYSYPTDLFKNIFEMENMQKNLAEMAVLSLSVKKEINYISPGSGTGSGKKKRGKLN
jgi:hypothetical protein